MAITTQADASPKMQLYESQGGTSGALRLQTRNDEIAKSVIEAGPGGLCDIDNKRRRRTSYIYNLAVNLKVIVCNPKDDVSYSLFSKWHRAVFGFHSRFHEWPNEKVICSHVGLLLITILATDTCPQSTFSCLAFERAYVASVW